MSKNVLMPSSPIRGLRDIHVPKSSGIDDTVRQFLFYQESIGNSPKTVTQYGWQLKRLSDFMNGRSLEDLDDDHLIAFQHSLRSAGLAPNTILNTRRAVNVLLNWAESRGMIQDNPSRRVKKPKVPKKLLPPIPQSDVQLILSHFKGSSPIQVRNRAIFSTWFDTGMRRAEIASLTVGQVDTSSGTVYITGKGQKTRIVFLGKTALQHYRQYATLRQGTPGEPLWLSYKGPLTSDGFRRLVERVRAETGVKFTSHDIRRTFAIMSLRNGADLLSVSRQLGHSDITSTTIYLDQNAADLQQVHDRTSPVDGMQRSRLGNRSSRT